MVHFKNNDIYLFFVLFLSLISWSAFGQNNQQCQPEERPSISKYTLLSTQLSAHSRRYYRGEASQISAYQYDQMVNQMLRWESCFHELTDNAYFMRVQGEQGQLPKRLHKMRSLHKTYEKADVAIFLEDVFGEYPETDFIVQPKIDGMALELIYRDGQLIEAATRGDGWRGESVLSQVQRMTFLPMVMDNHWQSLTIRGELYADAECAAPFIRKTPHRKKRRQYADLRQFAVATALSDAPDLVQVSCLRFVAYDWLECHLANDLACLDALEQLDFPTLLSHTGVLTTEDTYLIETWYERYQSSVADHGFLSDGLVFKVNSRGVRKILGNTAKAPHWAIALKYQQVSAIAEVLNISISYGRTGKVTPIIHIEPVTLAGRRITKLTGHSVSFMQQHQIGAGSHIEVQLQGGAVPMFHQLHIPAEKVWRFVNHASTLPLCLALREKHNPLDDDCHQRLIKQVQHFISKKGINVAGMGEKSIKRLIQAGVIQRTSDIFLIPSEALVAHLGWHQKKSKAFVLAVTNRRLLSFTQQLAAIGFPKFTQHDVRELAGKYNTLHELIKADNHQLPLSRKKQTVLQQLLADTKTRNELLALATLFTGLDE